MAKRTSEHRRAQHNGKVRDNFVCQICGSKHKIEGHHIIDHQFFGAAIIDNIISLCKKCHKEVHNGHIDLFKI